MQRISVSNWCKFSERESDVFEIDSRAAEGTILESVSSIPRLVPILNRHF